MRLWFAVVCCTATLAGCATTSNVAKDDDATAFFPLAVGNRWTYHLSPGPAQPQQVQILKRDERGFYVDDHGGLLSARSDGVFDGRRFLLQEPLVVDHSWSAQQLNQPLEHFRIAATDAVVTVPAGTFSSCIEVRGEQSTPAGAPEGKLLMTWTYARGVGLVRFEQQVQLGSEESQLVSTRYRAPKTTATMELVSFAVQPDPAPTP